MILEKARLCSNLFKNDILNDIEVWDNYELES